jgi:hypothetical protein
MKSTLAIKALVVGAITTGLALSANAQLTPNYTFNGNGDWSLSGDGLATDASGNLQAIVPVGSTVQAAFLYSAQYNVTSTVVLPSVTLAGTTYSGSAWTQLPVNTNGFLDAFRTDVTSQIQAAVGGGSASAFNFSLVQNSPSTSDNTDGEVLAIVFSNPADPVRSIALLDGTLSPSGATTVIHYASPLTGVGTSGFSEEMSLGDSFSYQGNSAQYSVVNVNGRRLTTSSGGSDDGQEQDGGLITVGGIGDSTANPSDPFLVGGTTGDVEPPVADEFNPPNPADTTHYDDELYDLGQGNGVSSDPFVANGDTSTTITTNNPSDDDNIFFLGLNATVANATVSNGVPDATSTAALLAVAAGALCFAARRKRSFAS